MKKFLINSKYYHNLYLPFQTTYDQVIVDGRPQRPNSIEVPNHYQANTNMNSYPNAYSPTHEANNVPHGFSPSYNHYAGGQQPYANNG